MGEGPRIPHRWDPWRKRMWNTAETLRRLDESRFRAEISRIEECLRVDANWNLDQPRSPLGEPAGGTFEWGAASVTARDALIDLLSRSATTFSWRLTYIQPLRYSLLSLVRVEVAKADGNGNVVVETLKYDRAPKPRRRLKSRCGSFLKAPLQFAKTEAAAPFAELHEQRHPAWPGLA